MSGIDRRDIFVTTKLWNEDIRQGRTKEAFLQSLEDMGLDYIDLYLIHWPANGYEKAWADMEDLYKAGKIKAIGVSNFNVHHLETLSETGQLYQRLTRLRFILITLILKMLNMLRRMVLQ